MHAGLLTLDMVDLEVRHQGNLLAPFRVPRILIW